MPLKEINLFGHDIKSISPLASSMRHMNCHYIIDPTLEKERVLVGFPGSEVFAKIGGKARGFHSVSNGKGLYVVQGTRVLKVERSGEVKLIGNIESETLPIYMADSGVQLMIVDGLAGYIVELTPPEGTEQTVTKITSEFFPKNPTSVIFNTGRFLVNNLGTGQFHGSKIFDGLVWDGLDFATAETFPDNIVSLANGGFGVFYLMGNETVETWYNTGGPDFPYALMSGGVMNVGLLSQRSIVTLGNSIIFLGISQTEGQNFYQLEGQSIQNITNSQMAFIIKEMANAPLTYACGYSANGSPIYQITFIGSNRTFFYDANIGLWGERSSRGIGSHIFGFGVYSLGEQYFTSRFGETIFRMNDKLIKDGDFFQDLEFVGRHISLDEDQFSLSELQFKMEVGQGELAKFYDNPVVMLSYSKDGGYSWTPELQGSIGRLGDYLIRLVWRRLGYATDFCVKLRITDIVKRKIISALISLR